MKIYAGPCLLNDNQAEIEDCYKTAERLSKIDNDIRFRCKLWGGGTKPEKYVAGIQDKGISILNNIGNNMMTGTEVKDSDQIYASVHYVWIAARSAQNYFLLKKIKQFDFEEILIKRHPGMTIDEVIGIYDICEKIYGYKPIMVERGINTFCRTEEARWMPDFQGMLRILTERPDVELCFDVSHACGRRDHIFPMVRAAVGLGVKNFMFEVMNDPSLSQTDKNQILSVEEFEEVHNFLNYGEVSW